jgi:dipeptidyl aminopeptidase/acylaminoacyl peptidase
MGTPDTGLRPVTGQSRRGRSSRSLVGILLGSVVGLTTVTVGTSGVAAAAGGTERISFARQLDGGGADIYTALPDGSDQRRVEIPYVSEDFGAGIWPHDGARLLFTNIPFEDPVTGDFVGFRPATSNADGSDFHLLALPDLPEDLACSAWSPDDTRILCGIGTDTPGIFSMNASDGSDLVPLTVNPFGAEDHAVGYSPDGTRLAFLRFRPGAATGPGEFRDDAVALFVAEPDGSHASRITPWGLLMPHEFASADWSPDGRHLVSSTPNTLILVRADGGRVAPIHLDLGTVHSFAAGPTFSPNGRQIMFSMFRNGQADLFRARIDGTHVRAVTHSPQNELSADWTAVPAT